MYTTLYHAAHHTVYRVHHAAHRTHLHLERARAPPPAYMRSACRGAAENKSQLVPLESNSFWASIFFTEFHCPQQLLGGALAVNIENGFLSGGNTYHSLYMYMCCT